jgi:gamma-glutamylaminecyclotransferase
MVSIEIPGIEYLVAVYGSLKSGRHNHGYLRTAKFVGRFRTAPEYTMIDLGAYPAILPGGSTAIDVEIYAVDADTIKALDTLEEHPDHFRRTPVSIANRNVFIYVLNERGMPGAQRRKRRIIESGCW